MNYSEPQFFSYMLGKQDRFPLEKRVLNAALLLSCCVTTLIIIESLILQLTAGAILLASVTTLVFWILFAFSRQELKHNWPMWTFLVVNSITILVDWFFIGGQIGIARPMLISITICVPIITKKKQFPYGCGILLLTYLTLLLGSNFFWQSIPTHPSNLHSAFEHLVEVGLLSIGMLTVAYITVNSYRIERLNAERLNSKLSMANTTLENRNLELEKALQEVKILRGILPICSYCKKIRNDKGYWDQLEKYLFEHTNVKMTHGICPECLKKEIPKIYKK